MATNIQWTVQDARIMGRIACIFADTLEGFAWKYTLGCIDSDRRDAKLMLEAHRMRAVHYKFNPIVADRINCGGCLRELWCDYPTVAPAGIRVVTVT